MELLTFQRIGSSRDTLPWPGSYLLHKTALTLYLNHYANCCLILFSSKKLKTQTSSKIGDHSFLLLLRMCMKYFIYILYIFHDCEKHNSPISNAERRLYTTGLSSVKPQWKPLAETQHNKVKTQLCNFRFSLRILRCWWNRRSSTLVTSKKIHNWIKTAATFGKILPLSFWQSLQAKSWAGQGTLIYPPTFRSGPSNNRNIALQTDFEF